MRHPTGIRFEGLGKPFVLCLEPCKAEPRWQPSVENILERSEPRWEQRCITAGTAGIEACKSGLSRDMMKQEAI